jgi:PilZ domain
MERRRSPRASIELECKLTRDRGGPVDAHTVDLGPDGMCVKCRRPLAEDELVEFAIPDREFLGRARVLREQGYHVYALRFEEIADSQRAALQALASASY